MHHLPEKQSLRNKESPSCLKLSNQRHQTISEALAQHLLLSAYSPCVLHAPVGSPLVLAQRELLNQVHHKLVAHRVVRLHTGTQPGALHVHRSLHAGIGGSETIIRFAVTNPQVARAQAAVPAARADSAAKLAGTHRVWYTGWRQARLQCCR